MFDRIILSPLWMCETVLNEIEKIHRKFGF